MNTSVLPSKRVHRRGSRGTGWIVLAVLVALAACSRPQPASAPDGVIEARSAGVRFPREPEALKSQIDDLLDKGGLPAPGPVAAIVIPHAGLPYSGEVAAQAIAAVRDRPYARVILLSGGHPAVAPGAVVPQAKLFKTPLGQIPIDVGAAALFAQTAHVRQEDAPYLDEHGIDAVLPLLQRAVGGVPVLPILVGEVKPDEARALAAGLLPLVDSRTLVVVSTNFTHYGARFGNTIFAPEEGPKLKERIAHADELILNPVLNDDLAAFDAVARKTTVCGQDALRVLLALLPRGTVGTVRAYDTSFSHDDGDRAEQVSYAAIVYPGSWPDIAPLPAETQKTLVDSARAALTAAVNHAPPPMPRLDSVRLQEERGVFVTLYEDGELRASVGQLTSNVPLGRAVVDIASKAASEDSRFPPLRAEELGKVKLELSVLGPVRAVRDLAQLQPERDGLFLDAPGHTALLLPDVATTEHLDADQLLDALADQAQLPREKWPAASLKAFEVRAVAEPGAAPRPVPTEPPQGPSDAGR